MRIWRRLSTALSIPGKLGHPPVILVCTHGQHDHCCAVRGRPVGRALSERWPELVWECSHVGGDRFAANVVVAPDGVYYGGLDAESSVATVEEHLAGRIHAEYLRGYTDLFPSQQAAVAAALRRFGPAGRNDYVVAATSRDGDHWRIRITGRPPHPAHIDVELQAHRAPAMPTDLPRAGDELGPGLRARFYLHSLKVGLPKAASLSGESPTVPIHPAGQPSFPGRCAAAGCPGRPTG